MYSAGDVTIIIPIHCYKEEQVDWLGECLASVKAQGAKVTVIDDGSPISIHRIVADAWQPGFRYVKNVNNEGVSHARNRGINLADTPLIFPLDADDTLRDGAIRTLSEQFNGTPIYPDLSFFGDRNVPHYNLMNFKCELLYQKVGISSVNVLHTRSQWKYVGGYKEDIMFYEDGEYNARLMLTYCGRRYPVPLVNYRMHPYQRTKKNRDIENQQARMILGVIKEYKGMCCGKKARSGMGAEAASPPSGLEMAAAATQFRQRRNTEMSIEDLPGTQGDRILAQYVGSEGAAKHYYRGLVSQYPYKVAYGGYYYVDPRDAKEPQDRVSKSLFVVSRQPAAPEVVVTETFQEAETETETEAERKPRTSPEKQPVTAEKVEEPLPDINNLKWLSEIRHMDFDPDTARKLYAIEKKGKGRVKVLGYLERRMNG